MCPYSFTVWINIAGRLLGAVITPDWEDTIESLLQSVPNRMDSVLRRMAFHTVLYAIWRERNSRRHGGDEATVEKLTRTIDKQIWNRISSLRYTAGHPLEELLKRWFQVIS